METHILPSGILVLWLFAASKPQLSLPQLMRYCLSAEISIYVPAEWSSKLDCCFVPADDSLGLTASRESELAISALGACVWYLKVCLVDHEILSLKRFEVYHPVDAEGVGTHVDTPQYITSRQHMVCMYVCMYM